jgi:bifunctional UDP-N-acetylglucosamine pyrophosphorylase/glucosamine-1-phosphate N-acetyltransferase
VGRRLVVIGHQADRVRAAFAQADVEWVLQAEQRGTGHAVLMAGPALEDFEGTLLVACGDTPLMRASTLNTLLERHKESGASVTVLSARVPDPTGYGRILRAADGRVTGIVEERDATEEQRRIDEINSATYAFEYKDLVKCSGVSRPGTRRASTLSTRCGCCSTRAAGGGLVRAGLSRAARDQHRGAAREADGSTAGSLGGEAAS